MHSFRFPELVGHYTKVLNYIFTFVALDTSTQLRKRVWPRRLVFEKTQFFRLLAKFFLKKKTYSDKSNGILWKHVENKRNVLLDTFLDFAGVSSYLTFKLSAYKSGCTIPFELQMSQTSSTSFWKNHRLSFVKIIGS